MFEIGKVTGLKGNRAVVRFNRKSSCDKCKMCLALPDNMHVEVELDNGVGAEVGDTVRVNMGAQYVLLSALICYMIPLLLAAAGLVTGALLWGDAGALILGAVTITAGFCVCHLIDKRIRKKKGFSPVIEAVTERAGAKDNGQDD